MLICKELYVYIIANDKRILYFLSSFTLYFVDTRFYYGLRRQPSVKLLRSLLFAIPLCVELRKSTGKKIKIIDVSISLILSLQSDSTSTLRGHVTLFYSRYLF